jgi:N-hydroxyarylamine O-acetyltransferase
VPALHRLVEAQTRHVPYETVWLYVGERRGISPRESLRHVVGEGRGGYCYQLNGAFCWLLRQLGYRAVLHRSSVHGPGAPTAVQWLNHAALVVDDLPDDTSPEGAWFADVGLGDGPNAAVPLVEGTHEQAPFHWLVAPPVTERFEVEVHHGPGGSFDRVGIADPVSSMRPFIARHRWLSTSPDSGFRKAVVVQRRDGGDVVTVRGLLFTRVGSDRRQETTIEWPEAWFDLLAAEFGVVLNDRSTAERQRLWRYVYAQHEAWLATDRPA